MVNQMGERPEDRKRKSLLQNNSNCQVRYIGSSLLKNRYKNVYEL